MNIAIVVSEFNKEITSKLLDGALLELTACHIRDTQIKIVHVPGAVEIPLAAKMLAKQKKFSAIICLGAVIRGETTHYDYVCEQVSHGIQKVMLSFEVPVIFGILTTENEAQAYERAGGIQGHKGKEAVTAALSMIELMQNLQRG